MGNFSSNPYNQNKYVNAKTYNDDTPIDLKRTTRGIQETAGLNVNECIKLETKLMYNKIQQYLLIFTVILLASRLQKGSQILPIMVSLKTTENKQLDKNIVKPGIDLVCVIDKSASMEGIELDLVKKTLNFILNFLDENDRLSLIIFESSAERLCPLIRVNQQNKQILKFIFENIKASGGTSINYGMVLALKTLKERKIVNHVSSIFLLSDGKDTRAEQLVEQSIKQYNIKSTFTINTFGFGGGHDAKLMKAISNMKDGNFYFIKTLEIVNECFIDALGGLFSIIAQNVKLKCKLIKNPIFSDMRICKTYGNWQYNEETQEYILTINQLFGGISRDNILEINIPPIKKQLEDNQKKLDLLSFKVEFQEIIEEERINEKEAILSLEFVNINEQFEQVKADKDVYINYLRVKGAQTMDEANKNAMEKKYQEAQDILDEAIQLLSISEYVDEPCLTVLLNDLKTSKSSCASTNYKIQGANLMVQKTNIHMFQRSAPMQSNEASCCEGQQDLYANQIQSKMRSQARALKF